MARRARSGYKNVGGRRRAVFRYEIEIDGTEAPKALGPIAASVPDILTAFG